MPCYLGAYVGTCHQPHFPSVDHVDTGEDRTLWSVGGKAPEVVYAQASRLYLNPQDINSVLEAIRQTIQEGQHQAYLHARGEGGLPHCSIYTAESVL